MKKVLMLVALTVVLAVSALSVAAETRATLDPIISPTATAEPGTTATSTRSSESPPTDDTSSSLPVILSVFAFGACGSLVVVSKKKAKAE